MRCDEVVEVGRLEHGIERASVDRELCGRLGRALDEAMADGDYVYADFARGLVIEMIQDIELRLRARAVLASARLRGELELVRALTALLVECDAGLVVWRQKVLALIEPAASEPAVVGDGG